MKLLNYLYQQCNYNINILFWLLFTIVIIVLLYCTKGNFNFVEWKHGRSFCVLVQSHEGDLFELIPIPLEPRGQSGGKGRDEATWGGGWIFLCNLPERFKNPGDPAIYLALCYAEPRQRKIDGVTASNPLIRPRTAPPRVNHPNPVQTPATTPSPSQ